MKYRKLIIFTSFIITSSLMLAFILLQTIDQKTSFFNAYYWIFILAIAGILFIINYILFENLLNYYVKRKIQEISSILPFDINDSAQKEINFKTINRKVTELNERRDIEIHTMREMETYRKEYLGNVSHELKTPLFSIQGYLEILTDGGIENLNIRDKYLDRIDQSVERLISIVKDLDMINQYENGKINLQLSTFDINSLIKKIVEMLEYEAEKKDALVKLSTLEPEIIAIADQQKISQVLINLISNAIYYSNREQAKITIVTRIVKNKIYIEVKDNGMGIKPEIVPRIFERFYRVETSRSRREGGSGLGLAIVKHILEAHEQNISVESKYLEGTKFTFTLDRG